MHTIPQPEEKVNNFFGDFNAFSDGKNGVLSRV